MTPSKDQTSKITPITKILRKTLSINYINRLELKHIVGVLAGKGSTRKSVEQLFL